MSTTLSEFETCTSCGRRKARNGKPLCYDCRVPPKKVNMILCTCGRHRTYDLETRLCYRCKASSTKQFVNSTYWNAIQARKRKPNV